MKATANTKYCSTSVGASVRPSVFSSHVPQRRITPEPPVPPEPAGSAAPRHAPSLLRPRMAMPEALASGSGATGGALLVPRVLHIDSDSGAALVLTSLLMPEAQVIHATTLAEARRLLRSELFSLVVLDPALSDGDGSVLLPVLLSTPLLVYAAHEPQWRPVQRQFLPKSWTSPRQLWSTISTLLGIAPGMTAGD